MLNLSPHTHKNIWIEEKGLQKKPSKLKTTKIQD